MKEVISYPVEPPAEELPPFELTDPDAPKITTHVISLKLKRTSRFYHKVIPLDNNNELELTIELIK